VNAITRIATGAIAVAIVLAAIVYWAQDEVVYPNAAEGPMARPPPPTAIQHWLRTPGGARVEAWLFLPEQASASTPVPAAIFFHGNSDYIENRLEYAEFYTSIGMACLLVEYRGYRRSTGTPGEAALTSDALAFHDWLIRRSDIDPARVIAHGHSLGAGVAAQLAARRPLRGVILVSAFVSLPELFGHYWLPGFLARDTYDTAAALSRFQGPVLIAHGGADGTVPPRHARRLAQIAAPAAVLALYPGVDHDVPWDWDAFAADIRRFLDRAGVSSSPYPADVR
jgi:fermentation-respiration switch protein FrsA (DUF1100 family)